MRKRICFAVLVLVAVAVVPAAADSQKPVTSPYVKWEKGPPHGADFFPITVWAQHPRNAKKYRAAGINTYVSLYRGPTEEQLAQLKEADMKVVCHQNQTGLKHINDSTIIAWMHGDEPDNAKDMARHWKDVSKIKKFWPDAPKKSFKQWGKWGPPIPPVRTQAGYAKIKAADPSRPVLVNLGQGVAYDRYPGRGIRSGHLEDYPEYIKGCDIVSFDIYPACHKKQEIAGKLWHVPKGVKRLKVWANDKVVWNCIECTRISNPELKKATPHQVKCEVWMSIIHGSMGLIYFVHEWQPKFNESALLDDPEMLSVVTAVNRRITELAPVLNSATIEGQATVSSSNENVPVAIMMKRYEGATYLFGVAMRDGKTDAMFIVNGLDGEKTVEVLGENRTLTAKNGIFRDSFKPWDVHLYKIR